MSELIGKKVVLTLKRSTISTVPKHRAFVQTLGLKKVGGRVALVGEGDHVGAQLVSDLIDGPAAIAAAQVAPVARVAVEETDRRAVAAIRPVDPFSLEVLSQRFDRTQELALLDGEGADRKLDRGPRLQQQKCVQERDGIFAAR